MRGGQFPHRLIHISPVLGVLLGATLCFAAQASAREQAPQAGSIGEASAASAVVSATPAPGPAPISMEEFEQRINRWLFLSYAQIGPFKEGTLRNLETGRIWQVEESDRVEDLLVLSIGSDGMKVRTGGREGTLFLQRQTGLYLVLDENVEAYDWGVDNPGPPAVDREHAFRGRVSFQSTGNNGFYFPENELQRVGNGPDEYERLNVALRFSKDTSSILVQSLGENQDWTRWAFTAGEAYQPGFPWPPRGTTVRLTPGRWHYISLHLIDDLGLRAGDRLKGLAFSAYEKDVLFDSVSLSQAVPAGAKAVK